VLKFNFLCSSELLRFIVVPMLPQSFQAEVCTDKENTETTDPVNQHRNPTTNTRQPGTKNNHQHPHPTIKVSIRQPTPDNHGIKNNHRQPQPTIKLSIRQPTPDNQHQTATTVICQIQLTINTNPRQPTPNNRQGIKKPKKI
jgi:hypothetical protein